MISRLNLKLKVLRLLLNKRILWYRADNQMIVRPGRMLGIMTGFSDFRDSQENFSNLRKYLLTQFPICSRMDDALLW